jgi:hypothetical protein
LNREALIQKDDKRLFRSVVAQFIGREEPDKSGNYENMEVKASKMTTIEWNNRN